MARSGSQPGMSCSSELRRPRAARIAAALALSWVGLYLHNLRELDLPLWRPENSATLFVAAGLAVAWWRWPGRGVGMLLMAWGALHLIAGAVLSVLPLGLFPFEPEQSLSHYASHLLYGLLQLPLLAGARQAVRAHASAIPPARDRDDG